MYVLHAKLMHHGLLFINELLTLHKLPCDDDLTIFSFNFHYSNKLLFLHDSI